MHNYARKSRLSCVNGRKKYTVLAKQNAFPLIGWKVKSVKAKWLLQMRYCHQSRERDIAMWVFQATNDG